MGAPTKPMEITPADLKTMVKAAGLNLGQGRERAMTPILSAWLSDAHELNRKMSEREHWAIVPKTVFTHSG